MYKNQQNRKKYIVIISVTVIMSQDKYFEEEIEEDVIVRFTLDILLSNQRICHHNYLSSLISFPRGHKSENERSHTDE